MAFGRCKLTLKSGTYVDSHIVPQGFTRPDPGQHFIEGGLGRRLTRRPGSWYDPRLVIRKGEDLLEDLDNFAIDVLRNNFVVWGGWGQATRLPCPEADLVGGYGVRRISNVDTRRLRLFFLSLMWRTAASNRPEFSNVALSDDALEKLRLAVVSGDSSPLNFMPIHLIQHSTIGPRHNLGPIKGSELPGEPDAAAPAIIASAYRFYFDGLVAYVCHDLSSEQYEEGKHLFVGESNSLLVGCVPFENSWQQTNLKNHIAAAQVEWPEVYDRLVR